MAEELWEVFNGDLFAGNKEGQYLEKATYFSLAPKLREVSVLKWGFSHFQRIAQRRVVFAGRLTKARRLSGSQRQIDGRLVKMSILRYVDHQVNCEHDTNLVTSDTVSSTSPRPPLHDNQ